jgi:MoxR-like ATPase
MELPPTFFVIATQNPVEYEGTYPLPEAQLDRFLLQVRMGYPDEGAERTLLASGRRPDQGHDLDALGVTTVGAPEEVAFAREELGEIVATEETVAYLLEVTRRTRRSTDVALGASPRAGLSWLAAAKALAALRGLTHVTPDDVKDMACPVLRHRIVLLPEAEMAGADPDEVVGGILDSVAVPR